MATVYPGEGILKSLSIYRKHEPQQHIRKGLEKENLADDPCGRGLSFFGGKLVYAPGNV